jgi:hypothetical protein
MKGGLRTALALIVMVGCDSKLLESSVSTVEEANQALSEGRSGQALELYRESQAQTLDETEAKRLKYDLGLAYMEQAQYRCAVRELATAMGSHDDALTQKAYAALGTSQARLALEFENDLEAAQLRWKTCQDCDVRTEQEGCDVGPPKEVLEIWKQAVRNYEQALQLDPTDAATLRNLEIALLRVDPPCLARDTKFERNDSLDAAHTLKFEAGAQEPSAPEGSTSKAQEVSWKEELLSCPTEGDFFKVELEDGDRLRVTLRATKGEGRLALVLLDESGRLVERKEGVSASDDFREAPRSVEISRMGQRAGANLIKIVNMDEEEVAYELKVTRTPSCLRLDDDFEQNDGFNQLADVTFTDEAKETPGPGRPPGQELKGKDKETWRRSLRICSGEGDYFLVHLEPGDRLSAEIKALDEKSAVHVALYSSGGEKLLRPASEQATTLRALDFSRGANGAANVVVAILNPKGEEQAYDLSLVRRPACSRLDVEFEPNDTPQEAHDISEAESVEKREFTALKLCPANPDYFAVTLLEGESVFAFVSPSQGDDEEDSKEETDKAEGLDLAITDAEGKILRGGGVSGKGRVATLLDPGPGRYLIKISGVDDYEGRYDLIVKTIPACPEGNDTHDLEGRSNNSSAEATVLAPPAPPQGGGPGAPAAQEPTPAPGYTHPMLGRICPGDVDYYRLPVEGENPTVVTITFDHGKGDLDMVLYDAEGTTEQARAAKSSEKSNGEALAIPPEADKRDVVLRVEAKDEGENFYLLRIQNPKPNEDSQDQEEKKDDKKKDDKKKDDKKKDDKKNEKPEEAPPKKEPPKKKESDPFKDLLDDLDRNEKNLEAERARRRHQKRRRQDDAGLEDY